MHQLLYISTGILWIACFISGAHAQQEAEPLFRSPPRISEVKKDDLVLINVAAKGRVVELLANELARTEIIRALLVEYARECVQNITLLEKQCLSCMIDRCQDRMLACDIKAPPLDEVLTHDPAPIKGVQFLSMSPADVDKDLREFAHNARTDILNGIPEALRPESESIMHSEVDQSLSDLNENMNTEKALKTISKHVQKVADNAHVLPEIGENIGDRVGTLIVENEDHAVTMAEELAKRLKSSRPFIMSINHNGGRIINHMPEVLDTVENKLEEFKETIGGVFGRVLGTFTRVMDMPDTQVVNGNLPGMMPRFNPNLQMPPRPMPPQFPAGPQISPAMGMRPEPIPRPGGVQRGSFLKNVIQGGKNLISRGKDMIRGSSQVEGQPQLPGLQSQLVQPGPNQPVQFIGGQTGGAQFKNVQFQGNQSPAQQRQQLQQQQMQLQQQQQLHLQQQQHHHHNQQPQQQQQQHKQQQQQMQQQQQKQQQQQQFLQGGKRRKRYAEPSCDNLELDPDTYCRMYESQCHNCTLEKRLRFEVCGEGVEKARDEIKRMDDSVKGYLQVYNEYIARNQLLLKIEVNDSNRLHKTNSHYDAFVTAKIGPSIFRYKTKMILNLRNVRNTGLQLGDELWEKLWENGILQEAAKVVIPTRKENIMGQNHLTDIHSAHGHAHAHAQSSGVSGISWMTSLFVSTLSVLLTIVL